MDRSIAHPFDSDYMSSISKMLDMFPGMACKIHGIALDLRFNNRGDRVETALMPSLQFASINGAYTNINCYQYNMIISQNRITFAIGTIKKPRL